ncbi:MAG: hypothetical protein ABIG99_00720 [Patescibacteria group bacterium]
MQNNFNIKKMSVWEIMVIILVCLITVGLFFWRSPNSENISSVNTLEIKINPPATYNEPMAINKSATETISIAPIGANAAKAVTKGKVTTYADAFTNTDIVHTKYDDRIKEDIIFKKLGHPASFSYQINVMPYEFGKNSDGDWMFYQKGHGGEEKYWVFTIPAPYMIDANGKESSTGDVDSEISDTGILSVTPSAIWLKKAKYPVTLDPTIVFRAGIAPAADTTTYIEDVFSAYTYTGNSATQNIVNGVDLAGKGGLVWIKKRSAAGNNRLFDSLRTLPNGISTNTTSEAADWTPNTLTSFNSDGFSMGSDSNGYINQDTHTAVSWSFAQANKFFKVAQVTKSAGSDATVDLSSLGTVGMVTVKRTDSTGDWYTWHRSLTAGKLVYLNQTAAEATLGHITVSGTTLTLEDGVIADGTYIVYAWAHDDGADGLIQCGSYVGNSASQSVTLGWEPQYLLVKNSIGGTGSWQINDNMRGLVNQDEKIQGYLLANSSNAEGDYTTAGKDALYGTATGFYMNITANSQYNTDTRTYIYCAIRRGPMRLPTSGTQVYNAIARTGTGAAATVTGVGFPPDLYIGQTRILFNGGIFVDRLRGAIPTLNTHLTGAEDTSSTDDILAFTMDGVSIGAGTGNRIINHNGYDYIYWFFRRYPGVFDEVAYTGDGSSVREISHSLGVAPTMIIVKRRDSTGSWYVYSPPGLTWTYGYGVLDGTAAYVNTGYDNAAFSSTVHSSSTFTLGNGSRVTYTNTDGATYVAYLFATKAGISKVGSYTGNGSSQTINAGFTGGAKFILIKRTDSTGDWYVWDSTRGIVAGNDPHLSLNTISAEVTDDDSIDPADSGFIVNEVAATHINVTDATYIYLAFSGDAATPTPRTPTVPIIFRASTGKPIIFRAPPH